MAYAAWLSVYGSGEQQRLAAEFVKYILQRAEKAGKEVYEKAREIVEEGKAKSSLTLKGFEKKIEVEGREHVVKVIDGWAELEESQSNRKLLRIRITAEVDGVKSEYTITFMQIRQKRGCGIRLCQGRRPGRQGGRRRETLSAGGSPYGRKAEDTPH